MKTTTNEFMNAISGEQETGVLSADSFNSLNNKIAKLSGVQRLG